MVRTRLVSSSSWASRLGTGRPRSPTWFLLVVDESPTAPSAIASVTRRPMAAISSAVASRSQAASPITYWRMAEWPMKVPTFIHGPIRSTASWYCAKVSHSQRMPAVSASSGMPST